MKLFSFLILVFVFSVPAFAQKMDAEEIIAKHLDSIGTKEKRESIKNQMAIGVSTFTVLTGTRSTATGNAVIATENKKIFFGVSYSSPNYPFEKVSFDGSKVNIAFITPGSRSAFGNFILSHKYIFSEGLFGGCLSSSWGLLDVPGRQGRISFGGKKKIKDKEAYILEYSPKRGADASIKLFFDAETFQHIRTEYRQTYSAAQGVQSTNQLGRTVDNSARQQESRHTLTEEFSDHRAENGITVPHKYRIHLLLEGRETSEFEWSLQLTNFLFNQKLDPKSFNVDGE